MTAPIDLEQMKQAGDWLTLGTQLRDDPRPDEAYAPALVSAMLASSFTASPGLEIYRARVMPLNRELDVEPLPLEDIGPPPASAEIPSGRFNRAGVSYFYGALESATAIAKCRPWQRVRITVGRFRSVRPLIIADLAGARSGIAPTPESDWLSFILGRPVYPEDGESYLPSQWLADVCQNRGMDGMFYSSSRRPGGVNAVLFSDEGLRCVARELYEVAAVSYSVQRLSSERDA